MSKYQKVATVTVSSASIAIVTGLKAGAVVEVVAMDADMWIHTTGGTAAAAAANCVVVPQNQSIRIEVEGATTQLTAIRDASTDARAQVSVVS